MSADTRVALVTGASSGIGAATALRLARAGFTVYGAARRTDRLAELETRSGGKIRALGLDLTDDASMVAGVKQVLAEAGRIDVLVNNAGYGSYGAIEDVPMEEARRQVEVNLFGLARLIQLALPAMRTQGEGTIVNITSIGGKITTPFGGWYHATKFAVEGLSDALRTEVEPYGVKVVVVEPGGIRTEWGDIAVENALAASTNGAYAARVQKLAESMNGPIAQRASDPDVVAQTIEKAVTARRPRTRYAVGFMARPALVARRVLPDRAMDVIQRRMLA